MSNNKESPDSQNPYRPTVSPEVESQQTPRPGRPLIFYLILSFPIAWMCAGILSFQAIMPLVRLFVESKTAQSAILLATWVLLTLSMTGWTAVMNKRQFEKPETTMRWKIASAVSAVLPAIIFVMYLGAIYYRYYRSL